MSVFSPHPGDGNWFLLIKITVGVAAFIAGPFLVKPTINSFNQARQSNNWPQTEAEITHSEIVRGDRRGKTSWDPKISYRYTVDGRTHTSTRVAWRGFESPIYSHAEEVVNKYPVGSRHQAFYSPEDHSLAVLEKGTNWLVTLALFAPLFFLVFGGMVAYENFVFLRDRLDKPKKKKKKRAKSKVKSQSNSSESAMRRRRRRIRGDQN